MSRSLQAGLALPGVIMETGMQAKLLARQMEGLLDADTTTNSGEATAVYREARNLGLLELKGKAGASMAAKFDSLAARLPEPVQDEPKVERTAPLKELISMLLSCQKATAAVPEEGEMIVEIFSNGLICGRGLLRSIKRTNVTVRATPPYRGFELTRRCLLDATRKVSLGRCRDKSVHSLYSFLFGCVKCGFISLDLFLGQVDNICRDLVPRQPNCLVDLLSQRLGRLVDRPLLRHLVP